MRKALFILILPLFILACNQNMLGVGHGVKNFFMTPFNGVKSLVTGNAYENLKEKTEKAKKDDDKKSSEVRYCLDHEGRTISSEDAQNFQDLLEHTTELVCECKEWGSCTKDLCSCEKLCPDNLNIFKRPPFKNTQEMTDPENGLAFRNESIGKNEMTNGYCWGHANINSQFNRMAFFNPGTKPPYNLNSSSVSEQQKAVEFYKKIIDRVTSNKATNIPGFKNLYEFSDHPALQSYLGDKMSETWADQAMSWQGVAVAAGAKAKSKSYYQNFLKNVKEKLEVGVQPTVVFTKKGSPFLTHAVLVSHIVKDERGNEKYCLRDNNDSDRDNARCLNYLHLSDQGVLSYPNSIFRALGDIKVAHNEEADMVAQANSLRERCLSDKDCGK